ncbi:hypothetical protein ACFE04_023653 [Oxalis oulophora]
MDSYSTTKKPTTPLPFSLQKFLELFLNDGFENNSVGFSRNDPFHSSFENLDSSFRNLQLTDHITVDDTSNGEFPVPAFPQDKSLLVHQQMSKARFEDKVYVPSEGIQDRSCCNTGFTNAQLFFLSPSLIEHIGNISHTGPGSHCLQKILSLRNPSYTWQIFERIVESMFDVMTDKYGHFVFENLIMICNNTQLEIIMEEILNQPEKFIETCKNNYGASSVNKLIIKVASSETMSTTLVVIFSLGFYKLMTCRIGSFAIVSCLKFLDIKKNGLLYEEAIKKCLTIACDVVGCVSLNKFIEFSKGARREEILRLISENSVFLAQDPFGNYVLQKVIDLHAPVFTELICNRLQGHYVRLSLQKTGSRVVERCICSPGRDYVLEELAHSTTLIRLATDQHGNYVLQTALKVP